MNIILFLDKAQNSCSTLFYVEALQLLGKVPFLRLKYIFFFAKFVTSLGTQK
jgi:hypothetical protein